MKVLFISRAYPPITGGMENFSYELTTNISKLIPSYIVANRRGKKFLPFFIPYAFFRALFLCKKVYLIHLGDPLLSIVGFFIKKLYKKPIVVNLHGLDITYHNRFYQWYINKFGKKFDKYVCISKQTKEKAIDNGFKNTAVIPVGINLNKFKGEYTKNDLEKVLNLNLENKKILITCGRLVKRKGVSWFIENVLPKLSKNIIYLVVGDGPEREKIEEITKKKSLSRQVFLLGRVSDEILKIIYNTADLFIMPNIKVKGDMEGFGIVALEAASCSLPVIASRLEGIPEAIQDKKNGFLVEPSDNQEYINKVDDLLKDENARIEFGKQARKFTKENYSWGKIANLYLEEFKKTLE